MTERELFKEAVMQYMVDDTRVMRVSKKKKDAPRRAAGVIRRGMRTGFV